MNELSNKSKGQRIPVKSKQGRPLNSEKEIEDRWIEHFKNILNQPDPAHFLDDIEPIEEVEEIEKGPITTTEVKIAKNKLKNNKAPEMDGIHPGIIKWASFKTMLQRHFLNIIIKPPHYYYFFFL